MKRYSVSYAREVNKQASKSGILFQYSGRTDDAEKEIELYKNSRHCIGIRITDSETKKVVFEDLRPFKGALILTLDNGYSVYKVTHKYVDLSLMREDEHMYRYEDCKYFKVLNVEREIY